MILFGKFCICRLQGVPVTKQDLLETEKRIMAKLSELAPTLLALEGKLTKIQDEVEKLREAFENSDVDIPAEAQESLDRLAALAQAIDDVNPDAPTENPPPPPPDNP